jgi:hypothetical protein
MSTAATLLVTGAGVVLVAVALRDIFSVLFHHEGRAEFSRLIMRTTWWLGRRVATRRPAILPVVGPLGVLATVAGWSVMLVTGWALIVWPHLPEAFRFDAGVARGDDLGEALYLSLVVLATIGFGDITPIDGWLRLVVPLEALVGLGLLSASISWLVTVHQVLGRRRSLAYEIWLLASAQRGWRGAVPPAGVLAALTSRLIAVERDMVAFPASYYFAENDSRFALAAAMPLLRQIAERARDAQPASEAALQAAMLGQAIDDFAATTGDRFHGARHGSTDQRLWAYAADHGVEPPPDDVAWTPGRPSSGRSAVPR